MSVKALLAVPPSAWADELDFAGPRVRTAPWAWLLLIAGLVAMTVMLSKADEAEASLRHAQDTVKRLERATRQDALHHAAGSRLESDAQTSAFAKPEARLAAAKLAQTLAYPWLPMLEKVERAAQTQQVLLLSFSMDLALLDPRTNTGAEARVGAAVMDDAQALTWVQSQGEQAQLLDRGRLSSPLATDAGDYAWRVEASLPGGQP